MRPSSHALWVSVEVAILSAIIATVLGTAASLGIASMSRKSRLLVTNITYIPVVNPEIITGISLMLLFVAYQRFATQSACCRTTSWACPRCSLRISRQRALRYL